MKNKKTISESALAAKTIKKLLSANFANVKFSAKSECFSGGDAVRISWSFGPTVDQVENLTNRFKGGYFDSMNDIYEYTPDKFEVSETGEVEKQPTVKFISTSRYFSISTDENQYSPKAYTDATTLICKAFNVENKADSNLFGNSFDYRDQASNVAARMLRNISFTSDQIELKDCYQTDKSCGQAEDLYSFTYTDLKAVVEVPKIKAVSVPVKKQLPKVEPVKVQTKKSFFQTILSIFTF